MGSADGKIPIAIVCNSVPPYRLHLHRRIVRELEGIRLWTVRTHQEDPRWTAPIDGKEIGLIAFPPGEDCGSLQQRRSFMREWRFGGRLIQWLRSAGVRAVVVCGYNDFARVRLMLWCRWHGIPCLLSGDSNINNDRLRSRGMRGVLKRIVVGGLLRLCRAALPFGIAGKRYFEKYGVPAERIFLFPLEPDYQLIRTLPDELIAEARRRYSLPDSRRRFLCCGRLIATKRLDLLIDAFCKLADRLPLWDLAILGDGPLRTELEKRVPEPSRDRVRWIGHLDDPGLVGAVQRCCDVLVLPTDWEAWALVINEALAAGMAVVSSSIPGAAADLIRDGENGRIFPAGDLRALEECLLEVAGEERLAAMRARAPYVLQDWIERADPVKGLRDALTALGAFSRPEPT